MSVVYEVIELLERLRTHPARMELVFGDEPLDFVDVMKTITATETVLIEIVLRLAQEIDELRVEHPTTTIKS